MQALLRAKQQPEAPQPAAALALFVSDAPPPIVANSALLHLADAFRSHPAIRPVLNLCLAHSSTRPASVLNPRLLLSRLAPILGSDDEPARMQALRALCSLAPLWAHEADVVVAVSARLLASQGAEAAEASAALSAASGLSELSNRACLSALEPLLSQSPSPTAQCAMPHFLLALSQQLHSRQHAARAFKLCVQQLVRPISSLTCSTALKVLTHLCLHRPELFREEFPKLLQWPSHLGGTVRELEGIRPSVRSCSTRKRKRNELPRQSGDSCHDTMIDVNDYSDSDETVCLLPIRLVAEIACMLRPEDGEYCAILIAAAYHKAAAAVALAWERRTKLLAACEFAPPISIELADAFVDASEAAYALKTVLSVPRLAGVVHALHGQDVSV